MKPLQPTRESLSAPIDCRKPDERHRRVEAKFLLLSTLNAPDLQRVVPSPTQHQLTRRRVCSKALDKFQFSLRRHSDERKIEKKVNIKACAIKIGLCIHYPHKASLGTWKFILNTEWKKVNEAILVVMIEKKRLKIFNFYGLFSFLRLNFVQRTELSLQNFCNPPTLDHKMWLWRESISRPATITFSISLTSPLQAVCSS